MRRLKPQNNYTYLIKGTEKVISFSSYIFLGGQPKYILLLSYLQDLEFLNICI